MIVELNGHGGVGKFTIGRCLADRMAGRLIDNHTIYNPAIAVTSFRSPEFYAMVRAVRGLVFAGAASIASTTPIILTVAQGRDSEWGRDWQHAIRTLADCRASALFGVNLVCGPREHERRISDPGRALMRKATDPALLRDGADRPVLLDHCDATFRLDTTDLDPAAAAAVIETWIARTGRPPGPGNIP